MPKPANVDLKQASAPKGMTTKDEVNYETPSELDRLEKMAKERDLRNPEELAEKRNHVARFEAWSWAMTHLKERQRPSEVSFGAPTGAKDFPDHQDPDTCVTKQDDGTYVVNGWVDVKNVSGETKRFDFVLKLRVSGDGAVRRWLLDGEPKLSLNKPTE